MEFILFLVVGVPLALFMPDRKIAHGAVKRPLSAWFRS
jgi:hypothetical protein